jgi:hypothetical protein
VGSLNPLRWTITIGATAIVTLALLITALSVTGLLNRSIASETERVPRAESASVEL